MPETIDELDPLQRGSLIHDVQFELFARLRDENLLPVRPGNLDRARQLLDAVIDGGRCPLPGRPCPGHRPRVGGWHRCDPRRSARMAAASKRGRLRLRAVAFRAVLRAGSTASSAAKPTRDRWPMPSTLTAASSFAARSTSSSAIPSGLLRVTDHKSGKFDGKRKQLIDGGKTLQPVFTRLPRKSCSPEKARSTCGRLYFCTSAGGFAEQTVPLDERARDAAMQVAEAVGDAIARPFLPAAPAEGQCERCDYRVVCGPYEERRSARKPQGNLEPLIDAAGIAMTDLADAECAIAGSSPNSARPSSLKRRPGPARRRRWSAASSG